MSGVLRFDQLDTTRQGAIRKNLETLRSRGASDAEIEAYLRDDEKLAPATPFDGPTRGASRTWGDEPGKVASALSGGVDATSMGFADEVGSFAPAVANFLTGDIENAKKSLARRKELKEQIVRRTEEARQANPKSYLGGELAASVVAAPSMIARLGPIAGGAAFGALSGAGHAEGDATDRALGSVVGAGVGAGVGAAASKVVAPAVGYVASKAAPIVRPVVERAAPAVRDVAARLADALEQRGVGLSTRDVGATRGRSMLAQAANKVRETAESFVPLTPRERAQELLLKNIGRDETSVGNLLADAQTLPANSPMSVLDLAGENTMGVARGSRAVPSKAKRAIPSALKDRAEGEHGRARAAIEEAAGAKGSDPALTGEALIAERRANAQPLYEKAYAAGSVEDPEIRAALELPAFRAAFKRAQRIAQLEGTELPDIYGEKAAQSTARVARESVASNTRTASGSLRQDWLQKSNDNALLDEMHGLSTRQGTNDAAAPWVRQTEYGDAVSGHRTGRHQFEQDGRAIRLINAELKQRGWTDDEIADALMTRAEREGMAAEPANDDDMLDFLIGRESQSAPSAPAAPATPKPSTPAPTVQALDYMKRGLDDVIESRMRAGKMGRTEARALRQRLSDVLGRVDDAVPDYRKARNQFASDSRLLDAHESGQSFLQTDDREIGRLIQSMTPGEREAYASSALNAIDKTIRSTGDTHDVYNKVFGNQLKRDALRALVGDEAFQGLKLEMEGIRRRTETRRFVTGGSNTVDKLGEQLDLETPGIPTAVLDLLKGNPLKASQSLGTSILLNRMKGITGETADELADMTTAGMQGGEVGRARLLSILEELEAARQRLTAREAARKGIAPLTRTLSGKAATETSPKNR